MQNSLKIAAFGAILIAGAFAAMPSIAQSVYPSYYTQPSYQMYPTYSSYQTYPTYTNQTYTQPQYQQPYNNTYGYGSYCPTLSYNLTLGTSDYSTSGQVSMLQRFLSARYSVNFQSGYYDSNTASYVARFQQEQGVYPVTGGVGPLTRAAIQRTCGGSYNPGYPTYPGYPQGNTTFRLNHDFTLYQGQAATESNNGQLMVTLKQLVTPYNYAYYFIGVNNTPTAVVINVGLSCRAGTYCIYYPNQTFTLEEGDDVEFQGYDIEVKSIDQGRATFRVTDDGSHTNDGRDATIDVTAPKSGAEVDQGDSIRIAWSSNHEPGNASVILDLYEDNGDKVGTITIESDTDGSYSWHVPERNTFCTQQYPNGLCGMDLRGDYYIKASLVDGNGFNGGSTIDSDTSGTFEINR